MEYSAKSIKKNAILNVIYTITNMVFPLITYPYVNRILFATGMGKVSFFTSVSNYAVMIGSLGLGTYGIRAVAKERDDENRLSRATAELLIINTVVTAAVIVVLLVSALFVDKFASEPILFFINILIIAATPLGLNWLYSGLEQYAYITKRTIIFKTISLGMVLIFVRTIDDYPIYTAITAFSSIGAYICNLLYSRKFVRFKLVKGLEYRKHLKPMLLLFASILAVSVYTNLDTIMLGFINGDREVGLYSVASKSKWLLLSAVNAVSAVLLPRLSNYISNNNIKVYNKTLKKSVSFVFLVTIPISVYFIAEAFDTVNILGGSDYHDAILCMQILMPILIISGFSNVTGNQVLIPQGRDSQFMRAVMIGAIVDVILNAALMPSLGCTGAAIATLVAELTQMSIQMHFAKDDIIMNIQFSTVIKAFLASVISCVVIVIIRRLITINSVASIMFTGIIFFCLYGVILLIAKEDYFMEMVELAKKILKQEKNNRF